MPHERYAKSAPCDAVCARAARRQRPTAVAAMSHPRDLRRLKYADLRASHPAPALLRPVVMIKMTARQKPSPAVTLDVSGLPIAPSVRSRVDRRIRRALVGVQSTPINVHVSFADVNGPKGGADIRCAIDVRIPRTAPIHAEAFAGRDFTAFDRSVAVITRRIAQRLRRRQEGQRRPKKYYVAKRLL